MFNLLFEAKEGENDDGLNGESFIVNGSEIFEMELTSLTVPSPEADGVTSVSEPEAVS